METNTAAFGLTTRNADRDGQNGFVAGITYDADHKVYRALGGCFSKKFKTLKGATDFMGRMGYDAYGNRA